MTVPLSLFLFLSVCLAYFVPPSVALWSAMLHVPRCYLDARSHHSRCSIRNASPAAMLSRFVIARCMLYAARCTLPAHCGRCACAPAQSPSPKSVHHYVNALNAHVNQDEVPLISRLLNLPQLCFPLLLLRLLGHRPVVFFAFILSSSRCCFVVFLFLLSLLCLAGA